MLKYVVLDPKGTTSMQRIPLKQYIDSKRQLLEAIDQIPTALMEYEVRKYCTIAVGSDGDNSTTLALKPKQTVVVEWVYNNPSCPTPNKVSIKDKEQDIPLSEHEVFWSHEKLSKWLMRHAKDGINTGHKP